MPVSKRRKPKGVSRKYQEPSKDNQYVRLASAGSSAIKAFRQTSFELRDTENRRARAQALSEGKNDPFKEQEEHFGTVYGVGDKIINPRTKISRKVVEVVKNKDGIFYAWLSENDTGYCSERTLIRYGKI